MSTADKKETGRLDDKKLLTQEIKKIQTQLQEATKKISRQQRKLEISKNRELALMQTNRALADIVKSYADREAVVLASWRTLQSTFRETIELD